MATRKTINSNTYEYLIHFQKLAKKTCKGELRLIATGNVVLKRRKQLLFANCKYQGIFIKIKLFKIPESDEKVKTIYSKTGYQGYQIKHLVSRGANLLCGW